MAGIYICIQHPVWRFIIQIHRGEYTPSHADMRMLSFVNTAFWAAPIMSFHPKYRQCAPMSDRLDLRDSQQAKNQANSLMYKKLTQEKRSRTAKASGKRMPQKGAS